GQPPAGRFERRGLQRRDRPVGAGADVDEQVPVLGDHVDQQPDQRGTVQGVLGGFVGVVPEGEAEPAGGFEHLVLHLGDVLVLAGEHAVRGHAPAVVDHAVRHGGEVVAQQLLQRARAVVLARVGPVAVVPQDVGAEAVGQRAQLGGGEIREGGVVAAQREQLVVRGQRREVGDVPVVGAGVVQPQAQALRANGLGELGEHVPAGAAAGGGEGGGGAVPEAEAVMVLRGGHDVAGAGAGGEAGDPARRVLGGVPV